MTRFEALQADLTEAILAAWPAAEGQIRFGAVQQPFKSSETSAVVRSVLTRERVGRQVVERFRVEIEGMFPRMGLPADTDTALYGLGDLLAVQIAPHCDDEDDLAAIARSQFGSRWFDPAVTSITPLDAAPEDKRLGVMVEISLATVVLQ